jgi:hypothetical protein
MRLTYKDPNDPELAKLSSGTHFFDGNNQERVVP